MSGSTEYEATVMIGGKPFRDLDHRSWDAHRRIEDMDRSRVAHQALSPMPALLSYWFSPTLGLEMCHWVNDTIADMVAIAPDRFSGLGMVPLQDPSLAVKYLHRLKTEGFAGIEIGSNINGVMLGDRQFEEVYAAAEELDMAIFVHPLQPIGADRLKATPELIPFSAFPLETALAAMSLIRAGIPAKYPKLKMGFSHGGGAVVALAHRLTQGWKISDKFQGQLPESPDTYARRFFYDNLVYDPIYADYLSKTFSPGQVFSGTDYPFTIRETDPAGFIDQADPDQLAALRFEAASRFLGLQQ
jgi:aminocarboxymuconate-semialdehyde decarboxylase